MKRFLVTTGVWMLIIMLFAACSGDNNTPEPEERPETVRGKSLVAYFSAQTANANVDGVSGATDIIRENSNNYGAAQYLAQMIAQKTNADTLRIFVEANHYAADYNTMAYGTARDERDNNARPRIYSRRVDLANVDNVFIVIPIWWYTLPMPVYTFLDDYNLSGKNIYVATTHAGSGLADAIAVLRREEPNANVSDNGFSVRANNVRSSTSADVDRWLQQLGFEN